MLRCTLPHETKVRREWHSAVRRTLESFTDNARVINAAMACWSTPDRGVIHTAVEDESIGWQAPTTRMIGNDGKWEFIDGTPPTFGRCEHWNVDSDDGDVADLTDGATGVITAAAESDAAAEKKVRTATDGAEYNADWNGIYSSNDPALATLRLLHSARQMVGTSRWWTLRVPNSAISLLGTACGLSTEGTFKLLRVLRKVMVQHKAAARRRGRGPHTVVIVVVDAARANQRGLVRRDLGRRGGRGGGILQRGQRRNDDRGHRGAFDRRGAVGAGRDGAQ